MVNKYLRIVLVVSLFGCEGGFLDMRDLPPYLPYVRKILDLGPIFNDYNLKQPHLAYASFLAPRNGVEDVAIHIATLTNTSSTQSILLVPRGDFKTHTMIFPPLGRYLHVTIGETTGGWRSGITDWNFSRQTIATLTASYPTYALFEPNIISALDLGIVSSNQNYLLSFRVEHYPYLFYKISFSNISTNYSNVINEKTFTTGQNPYPLPENQGNLEFQQIIPWDTNQFACLIHSNVSNTGAVAVVAVDYTLVSAPQILDFPLKNFPTRTFLNGQRYNWLTRDGVVFHDEGGKRVTLYPLNSSPPTELRNLGDLRPMAFTIDGSEWIAYNPKNRRLFLLKTWWK